MKVGFTATRHGITAKQYLAALDWLKDNARGEVTEVHHGCCIGGDSDLHLMVIRNRIGTPDRQWAEIHVYPSNLKGMTDEDAKALADVVHDPKPPLDRNRDIVNAVDVVIACPDGPERTRSGTWYTVREARAAGKVVIVVMPDGSIE